MGLDLQGGMYLVLEVEDGQGVENAAENLAEEIKDTLRTKKIGFTKVARTGSLGHRSRPAVQRPVE